MVFVWHLLEGGVYRKYGNIETVGSPHHAHRNYRDSNQKIMILCDTDFSY